MVIRLINFQYNSAVENMAIDEAIFQETVRYKKSPTLRFYGWQPAAVSIGYFQDLDTEVNAARCRDAGVDIVRRITGGKAVFHGDDLTYSVMSCDQGKIFPADILGTYRIISECIALGLSYLGIQTTLEETGRSVKNADFKSCCFSYPSRNELLIAGRKKICGSAQMRSQGGFLQHGSLPISFDHLLTASFLLPSRTEKQLELLRDSVAAINDEAGFAIDLGVICTNLVKGFSSVLGLEIEEGGLTPAEENIKRELMNKYKNLCWNSEDKKTKI
jgi:lipoyl(octanoyl) transferase